MIILDDKQKQQIDRLLTVTYWRGVSLGAQLGLIASLTGHLLGMLLYQLFR